MIGSVRNRPGIAHLLLWTAATGLALLYFQSRRPPPPETIGFGSFISQPGMDVKAAKADARQRLWNSMQRAYFVGLAFSPVYGVALAGIGLALWRTFTGRFGFPAQPGHWVLLVIGGVTGILASRPLLRSLPLSADGEDFVLACLMLVVATAAAIAVGDSVWRLPMACASLGLTILCLSYAISFRSQAIQPPETFVLGFFLVALVPVLGLLATACDLAGRKRFDIFHWFGVAALVGVLGHFLVLVGAAWVLNAA